VDSRRPRRIDHDRRADTRLTTALEQPRAVRTSNPLARLFHTAAQALPPPTEAFGLFSDPDPAGAGRGSRLAAPAPCRGVVLVMPI
jgi:hypothetical protein